MAQLIFIGGFGSNHEQVDLVTDALSLHYDQEVIGIPFSEAQLRLSEIAQLATDSTIITHSAGLLLCEDMTPKEIIAIAPPVPVNMPVLSWRVVTKTVSLMRSGYMLDARARKIHNYHMRAFREHLMRPRLNFGQSARICRFDPAQLAVKMINRGVTVTLGFMDHDVLYPHSSRHVHVDMARRHGAIVHEDLTGHHDEFLLYPLKILEQLHRL